MLLTKNDHEIRPSHQFDPSVSCFFNALIKETAHWRLETQPAGPVFAFDLPDGGALWVPCFHDSRTGRHGLSAPCYLRASNGAVAPLDFANAAKLALQSIPVSPREATRVLERVLRSDHNVRDALEARSADLDRLFTKPLDFADAETGLLVGHSVHPCPKDRTLFSASDAQAYAPEYLGTFSLQWVAVRTPHLKHLPASGWEHPALVAALAERDATLDSRLQAMRGDEWLIPCHPFQLQHWKAIPALARRLTSGEMRVLGESDLRWRATSSLRAIYCDQAPWMLKFSLTVKLTNSLRHLHPEELARGPQLADLLATPPGRAFQARFPQMEILPEPVATALVDDAGAILPETGVIWRANPFLGEAARNKEVLATLLQDDPRDGVPRLAKRLRAEGVADPEGASRWFDRYLDVVVRPLLLAQADYGLLFGAHQQNIILALDGVWPEKMYFRDCQGTGFSPLARRTMGNAVAALEAEGALAFDEDTTATLFAYYLFINATFNVISSLAMPGLVPEGKLVGRLRDFLTRLQEQGVEDDSVIRHLLTARDLHIKGNFHYALTGLNETTQTDLLGLYRPFPNPLREGGA